MLLHNTSTIDYFWAKINLTPCLMGCLKLQSLKIFNYKVVDSRNFRPNPENASSNPNVV